MSTHTNRSGIDQEKLRARLYAAHQKTLDAYWDPQGRFIWKQNPDAGHSYRAILWHCLSYLSGDARCVERANRIIVANYDPAPCHFAIGAAIDVLQAHDARLTPEARDTLWRYLKLNLSFMATEDLKIHGYNDNHPMKAYHALVVGGEMLGLPHYVELGISRMRRAIELYERNGFPCEYNSPNYTAVSLCPLAHLIEETKTPEAREVASRIEAFFWQDLALHFDGRCGLPAGPFSRGGANDYGGMFSSTLMLVSHLFPHRYDFDVVDELFVKGDASRLQMVFTPSILPFVHAHPVWFASATYHLPDGLEAAIFDKPAGTYVRGTSESGTAAVTWSDPAHRPAGAPAMHHLGPRRSLLTTWYDEDFSLGTAQYGWLDNAQAHAIVANVKTGPKRSPEAAAVYYARCFHDERYPFGEREKYDVAYFRDAGEPRTIQHRNTAIVFYNPLPIRASVQRLRTGLFRTMRFNAPRALYVGDRHISNLNHIADRPLPVAIDEGSVYVGMIPLRLTDLGQGRLNHLQVHTYGEHLSILLSTFEDWQPKVLSYEQIVTACSGFVLEVHAAGDFGSFADFRRFLADVQIEDAYFADMRTTTYRRPGLTLSTCYSPYQSAFRHAAINGRAVEVPSLQVEGMQAPTWWSAGA